MVSLSQRIAPFLSVLGGDSAIDNVVEALETPMLATLLHDRGVQCQDVAVDVIPAGRGWVRPHPTAAATSRQISARGALGAEEIDKGLLRTAASPIAAGRSAELAEAGAGRRRRPGR